MKIFLSSLEHGAECKDGTALVDYFVSRGLKMKYNLISYYYISNEKQYKLSETIRDNSELTIVDSGAHSLQKGKKVDWDKYTQDYASFIQRYDNDSVIGYFEMDVDNIIGYDNVLKLREILEQSSGKIIPVWHKNRGIQDYKDMCKKYTGKIIAITGFRNEDIRDEQYLMFLKYAKKYDCKVHCLGMTRKKVLDKVPFDYTDSSSWKQAAIYGKIGNKKVTKESSQARTGAIMLQAYIQGMEMQKYYERKWSTI
jgi:hypothetical protein